MITNYLKRKLDRYLAPDKVFNVAAHIRDAWVAAKAASIAKGSRVLDAGAGQSPYRRLFDHCNYKTQDFARYEGTSTGTQVENWQYTELDYVSDITAIPVPDGSFDVVLCTEVLEHVPRPVETIQELIRILAPQGRLLLTAPLASGLHQQPYHFYGGFSPHFYKTFLPEFGLEIVELKPIGGLMKHVGQEVYRAGRILEDRTPAKMTATVKYILMCWLPVFLARLDDEIFVEEFTIGYLVEARKKS